MVGASTLITCKRTVFHDAKVMEVWIKFYLHPLALSFPDDGFSKMFFKICFFDTPPQGWNQRVYKTPEKMVCVFFCFFGRRNIRRLPIWVGRKVTFQGKISRLNFGRVSPTWASDSGARYREMWVRVHARPLGDLGWGRRSVFFFLM